MIGQILCCQSSGVGIDNNVGGSGVGTDILIIFVVGGGIEVDVTVPS